MDKTLLFNKIDMVNFDVNGLFDLLRKYEDEEKCIKFFEECRWNGNPISPFDKNSKVYKCKDGQYICKNTNKKFNVKTGTILENTKIALNKWIGAFWLLATNTTGYTSVKLAKDLGISQRSAWYLLHRIRLIMKKWNGFAMTDNVEIDESFIGGKSANRHSANKVRHSQGRSFKDKIPVLGLLERGSGLMTATVVKSTSAKDLLPYIQTHVELYAKIFSDEWAAYKKLRFMFEHKAVDHGCGLYVKGEAHTNNIEGAWKILKNTIRTYVHVRKLQCYVDEFIFRRNTRKLKESEKVVCLLGNLEGRMRYRNLVNSFNVMPFLKDIMEKQ